MCGAQCLQGEEEAGLVVAREAGGEAEGDAGGVEVGERGGGFGGGVGLCGC